MATVTMSIRIDSDLKSRAEAFAAALGTTMDALVSEVLEQAVQDLEIPPSPYLSTPETLEANLREAEEARENGVPFIPIEEVLADLDHILAEAEGVGA